MRLITKNWWTLKKMFRWKPNMGSKFSKIFTSKNIPPPSRNDGRKKNSKNSIPYIHQNDEFWKFCLLEKCFRIPIFLIFWARKSPLDMGSWLVLKKISSNNIKYVKLCEELMYRGICWNNHFFVGFSTCQTLQTQRSRSFDPFDLLFFFPCR